MEDEERPAQATPPEAKEDPIESDDASSVFSWHHAEGPRSLRRASTSRSGRGVGLDRDERTLGLTRSISRITRHNTTFSHPLTTEKTGPDVLVDFEGPDDLYRPMNWPFRKKAAHTAIYGGLAASTSFATSVYSPAIAQISQEFGVIDEVGTVGLSLLLVGLGLGPLIWGPASEVWGRKWCILVPVVISGIFSFAGGAAANIQTLMFCRFFAGFFGAAPVCSTGGVLADIWAPKERGLALIGYSIAVVAAPTIGPLIGASITQSYLGWRWTQYITGILQMAVAVLALLFVQESYPGRLLVHKAQRLRHEGGNWALHAEMEEWDISIYELSHKYLIRPIHILGTPIGMLMIFYASFCYGLIYACLGAFEIIFTEYYGWQPVPATLPFFAELIGILIGSALNASNQGRFFRALQANGGKPVPEARLYPMMYASPLLMAGIFVLAWTAQYRVFWFVPCVGIAMIGVGEYLQLNTCLG